ncbi:MAG: DUF896 domain-containing protein [Lachnospiraceae bacterium]|nr:DUF896 domain-containing protein [Lachnospiraceae bacterium]
MTEEKIARINELARKAKTPEGLTPEETEERAALRKEYIDDFRRSTENAIESLRIVRPDGSVEIPKKKS